MEGKTEEGEPKRQLTALPARSRINADKELWDKMTFLQQDCRTSGKPYTISLLRKKNFNPVKKRCYSSFRTKLYKRRNRISLLV